MTFFNSIRKKEIKKPKFDAVVLKEIIGVTLLLLMCIYTFKNSTIYTNLIYLSSNLENFEIFPSSIELTKNIYPVFNEQNYLFDEEKIEETAVDKEEVIKEDIVIDSVNYGTIDYIDKYEARDYFNNISNLPVSITNRTRI